MKRYKAYLFDFDYTLVDSSKGIVMCFRHVLEKHGFAHVTDAEIKRTIGKTLEESFTILTGEYDKGKLQEWRKEYVEKANTCMTVHTRFFSETKSVLESLKNQGVKLGIISTKFRYRIQEFTDLALSTGFFDIVVGGEDVQQPKPAPEGIFLALQQLACNPEDCLYLGDSTVDAETARSAGVDFAGVLHGATTLKELQAYPHVAIMNDLNLLLKENA